jgi:hypothetical protein
VANLQRELVVPIMRAKEIASDVSENIFKPIRDSLRAMNQEMAVESDAEVRIEAANIANASKGVAEPKVQTPNEKPLDREQILS